MEDTLVASLKEDVLEEVKEAECYGEFTGNTKWFNDKLGYGFITICDGNDKGKDIFVHHSGIKPLNSNYKTLRKGEYIQFNIINGMNGLQAVDVTGIKGGPLMCDYVANKRVMGPPPVTDWQTVPQRKIVRGEGGGGRGGRGTYKNVAKYNKATRNA